MEATALLHCQTLGRQTCPCPARYGPGHRIAEWKAVKAMVIQPSCKVTKLKTYLKASQQVCLREVFCNSSAVSEQCQIFPPTATGFHY